MDLQNKLEIISICRGLSCGLESEKFIENLSKAIEREKLSNFVDITSSTCKSFCGVGVNISFLISKKQFYNITTDKIDILIEQLKDIISNIE